MDRSSPSNEVITNLTYTDVVEDNMLEGKSLLKSELMKFWEVETFFGDVNDIAYENVNETVFHSNLM